MCDLHDVLVTQLAYEVVLAWRQTFTVLVNATALPQ